MTCGERARPRALPASTTFRLDFRRGEEGANDCGGRPSSDCRKRTMGALASPRWSSCGFLAPLIGGSRTAVLPRSRDSADICTRPSGPHCKKENSSYDGVSWDLRRLQWRRCPGCWVGSTQILFTANDIPSRNDRARALESRHDDDGDVPWPSGGDPRGKRPVSTSSEVSNSQPTSSPKLGSGPVISWLRSAAAQVCSPRRSAEPGLA